MLIDSDYTDFVWIAEIFNKISIGFLKYLLFAVQHIVNHYITVLKQIGWISRKPNNLVNTWAILPIETLNYMFIITMLIVIQWNNFKGFHILNIKIIGLHHIIVVSTYYF